MVAVIVLMLVLLGAGGYVWHAFNAQTPLYARSLDRNGEVIYELINGNHGDAADEILWRSGGWIECLVWDRTKDGNGFHGPMYAFASTGQVFEIEPLQNYDYFVVDSVEYRASFREFWYPRSPKRRPDPGP